uniref:Uncharacterized protein n=1 Tax=Strongyloides venezuelensis TaxID=75913 RepID=A0A0K0FTZ4_STRVS
MPNLKRNSTCLLDTFTDTEPDTQPPLKKPRLLAVFSNRVKSKLKNLSLPKSLFRNKSKVKCDTIPYSSFDLGKLEKGEASGSKSLTKDKELNSSKLIHSFYRRPFEPTNDLYKSASFNFPPLNLPPPTFKKSENIETFMTFDTNFTKNVIGNSQPNKRFRMEQEALAKNIFNM